MSRSHYDISLFFDHNVDVRSRTLYLSYGVEGEDVELDQKCAADMIKGLTLLELLGPDKDIHIIINCQGGDVDAGLGIYDKIKSLSNCQVTATVMGSAWSMAAWILQAADIRRMTKHSSLMIHDGSGRKDKFTKKQDIFMRKILLDRIREKHPQYPVSKLQRFLDTDTYFSADEALELGLIDEVVD